MLLSVSYLSAKLAPGCNIIGKSQPKTAWHSGFQHDLSCMKYFVGDNPYHASWLNVFFELVLFSIKNHAYNILFSMKIMLTIFTNCRMYVVCGHNWNRGAAVLDWWRLMFAIWKKNHGAPLITHIKFVISTYDFPHVTDLNPLLCNCVKTRNHYLTHIINKDD